MKWNWCLVKDDGTLATGWQQIENYWYFLEGNGAMKTGWLNNSYYLNEGSNSDIPVGAMVAGWIQLNNKWYYFETQSNGNKGSIYKNGTYTIDGKSYTFDLDGVWIEDFSLVSNRLIDFIKSFEGFSATPYYDEVQVLTLGYGMTGEEIQGISEVTEEQATSMLKDWINNKYAPVIKADLDSKGIALKESEFDALVSFAYNCGTDGLLGSTLYKRICQGVRDTSLIANFQSWSNGGGVRIEGLYRRRTKEANMFLYGDYSGNN